MKTKRKSTGKRLRREISNRKTEEPRTWVDAKGLVTCMARRQRDDWQRKGLDATVWIRMLAKMKLKNRRQKA